MVLINGDPISLILTSICVGVGAGVGSALGAALYKALLEEKVNAFLDRKRHEERLKKLKDKISNIEPKLSTQNSVVDNILGKNDKD